MWCRPEPSSVSPMYMPGRLRTASSPRNTLMESAPYSFLAAADDCCPAFCILSSSNFVTRAEDVGARAATMGDHRRSPGGDDRVADAEELRPIPQGVKQLFFGSRQPGLRAHRQHRFEQRLPPRWVEMGRHLVEQKDRRCAPRRRLQ